MSDLFTVKNCWMHYIGKQYATDQKFLKEAGKHGFSRRIPAQIARGMNFGDRIVLLRWNQGKPVAFGEARLSRIIFDGDVAGKVGERLQKDGKAVYNDSNLGMTVKRECGSYCLGGSWTVDCDLSEIVEMALDEADGEKLFCMIGGTHVIAYDKPIRLHPAPNFTRGFTKLTHDAEFVPYDEEQTQTMIAVENYRKKPRQGKLPGHSRTKQPGLAFGT